MVAIIVSDALHLQSSTTVEDTIQKLRSKQRYHPNHHQQQQKQHSPKEQGGERRPRLTRSVRFADHIRVREIPHSSTLSDQERQAYYWSKQDRDRIQKEIVTILRTNIRQNGGIFCYLDEDSLRGLEVFASIASSSSSTSFSPSLRRQAYRLLLKRQKTVKIIDEDWLRSEYRPFSEAAAEIARARGLRDEEVAPSLAPRLNLMIR